MEDKTDDTNELPRSWQVGYADLGTFSMIGTSAKQVAGVIMHLKHKFEPKPNELVPIQVLAMDGEEGTTWILPALITGVFNEVKFPMMSSHDEEVVRALEAVVKTSLPEGITVAVVAPPEEDSDD